MSCDRVIAFSLRDCQACFKQAKPIHRRHHRHPSHSWTAGCNWGAAELLANSFCLHPHPPSHLLMCSSTFSASISKTLCNCAQVTLKLCAIKPVAFFFFFPSYRPPPGLILFIRWTIQFPRANKGGRCSTVPPSLRIHSWRKPLKRSSPSPSRNPPPPP